jgi:nicotinate phosphoribosyltransferase
MNTMYQSLAVEQTDSSLIPSVADLVLLTDLYQLTMAACYFQEGMAEQQASFEMTVRRLPSNYGYLVAMGLAPVLAYLQTLRFSQAHCEYLQKTGLFDRAPESFWQALVNFRFTGKVWAVPEGTVVFAQEPFIRIEAPLWQAQLVETFILNAINYQTLIATRAARLRDLVGDTAQLLEFGSRRAFSPQAALWAARAALAAGFDATSNVLAAYRLGRVPTGTMAHALVMAIDAQQGSEMGAFTAFHRCFPQAALLIDTFDTEAAIAQLAAQVAAGALEVSAVRIDSGDLVRLSQVVATQLPGTAVIASGDLDEGEIERLQRAGAQIQAYGIGTRLVTGSPVNGVYKLVALGETGVMKIAPDKVTLPGRKQIFRQEAGDGSVCGHRLGLMTDAPAADESALLVPQSLTGHAEPLETLARRVRAEVLRLPESVRRRSQPEAIAVPLSSALQALTAQVQARHAIAP